MKTFALVMISMTALLLTACDSKSPFKPKTELRTMIIGGVPVHERDYKTPEKLLVEDVRLEK